MVTGAVAPDATTARPHVLRPDRDPFYRYAGHAPLKSFPPGTPLRTRTVTVTLTRNRAVPGEQVLYRTTDAVGAPVVSVTTIVVPAAAMLAPKVAAYLSFYDSLGDRCDPSYTLRGGNPGAGNRTSAEVEQSVVSTLFGDGYIVTDPDFEDEHRDFFAGSESGRSSLDAIKATLSVLGLRRTTTPVALMGYSGGSIAADWASELAPRYAPLLDLVGVAEGGMPVDVRHNARYINGTRRWSDLTPAALIGLARAYRINLRRYLSPLGRAIVRIESHECIRQFLGRWPGLTTRELVKPRYRDVFRIPAMRRIANRQIMGTAAGHPQEPLLIVAGVQDGVGDGVMVEADQQSLAYEYCRQGVPVDFQRLTKVDHDQAGVAFVPQAISYIADRFGAVPAPTNCGSFAGAKA